MEKITKKQMYEGMVAYFRGEDTEITEGMFAEFCLAQIADLDKKAVKAKERAAKKKAEAEDAEASAEKTIFNSSVFQIGIS